MRMRIGLLLALLISSTAMAQEFNKFQVGAGLGYAQTTQRKGVTVYVEPRYRFVECVAVFAKLETATMASIQTSDPAATIISFSLGGQYYFGRNKFRPFAGAGIGSYYLSSDFLAGGFQSINSFGYYPRVGFDYGQLNITFDYNIITEKIPETTTILGLPAGTTTQREANHFCLKIGYFFGNRSVN